MRQKRFSLFQLLLAAALTAAVVLAAGALAVPCPLRGARRRPPVQACPLTNPPSPAASAADALTTGPPQRPLHPLAHPRAPPPSPARTWAPRRTPPGTAACASPRG